MENQYYSYTQYFILLLLSFTLFSMRAYRLYIDVYLNKKITTELSFDDIYFRPDPELFINQ